MSPTPHALQRSALRTTGMLPKVCNCVKGGGLLSPHYHTPGGVPARDMGAMQCLPFRPGKTKRDGALRRHAGIGLHSMSKQRGYATDRSR
jgi:hypothetical protein